MVYRGPKPTIPPFTKGDPREFARLKVALENLLPEDATERFKYQILLDHLKHEDALLIADSYINSAQPYTDTMSSLTERYGQPHQLALRKIADLMESSSIARGDTAGFKRFALRVRALVGLLEQLGESGQTELCCGSHVTRLLSKLPQDMRAEFKRFLYPMRVTIPSLLHFSDWLNYELKIQETVYESLHSEVKSSSESKTARRHDNKGNKNTSIFHTTNKPSDAPPTEQVPAIPKRSAFCPYCVNTLHYLDQCGNFALLTVEQRSSWIKFNRRCWRCGRSHQAAQCRLKVTCPKCKGKHLQALHDVNAKPPETPLSPVSSTNEVLYLDRRSGCNQVLLKISRVLLRNGENSLETYAVLDDGSERTILLPAAAQTLKLIGEPEDLALRTVRQDIKVMHGASVSFSISPADQPQKTFTIKGAFTAEPLSLAEHSYSVETLQRKYRHLRGLPLPTMNRGAPLLLIGSDYPHLITPVAPVRLGRHGGPAASEEHAAAQGTKEAVLANLRSTEKRLKRDPEKAAAYCNEIDKLESAGYVVKVPEEELISAKESWFIPHHMGDNLNQLLLPGPTLTSSLLGVLLRFREYAVAVCSDIKGMFHQVRLLPEDKTLLCFLWRNLQTENHLASTCGRPGPSNAQSSSHGAAGPSLPQAVYEDAEPLSRRRWRHSQVLAEQFWTHFIRKLPADASDSLKMAQGPSAAASWDHRHGDGPSVPRALWPVGLSPVFSLDVMDGFGQLLSRSKTRHTQDLWHALVALPAMPRPRRGHRTSFLSGKFAGQIWGRL
ncbi:hypothetical protein WMY93_032490 [Mugilogobius chulae]|uniref:Peptidase A2 domain-containing protein n=1 Tax=Mugilogobius chulae TaxID=88201 RepID=A0AAW0MRR0_9GOBI